MKISYHKSLKRLLGVPYWYSNHDVCNHLNFKTFDNVVNINIFQFMFQIQRTDSPCIKYIRQYLLFDSKLAERADQIAYKFYGFTRVLDNDFDAIIACVKRVQTGYISQIPYAQLLNI